MQKSNEMHLKFLKRDLKRIHRIKYNEKRPLCLYINLVFNYIWLLLNFNSMK